MEPGHQNHSKDGLLGPNSIMVLSLDPLGIRDSLYATIVRLIGVRLQSSRDLCYKIGFIVGKRDLWQRIGCPN